MRRDAKTIGILWLCTVLACVSALPAAAQSGDQAAAPSDAKAMEQRADLHLARKEYEEAATIYRRLTQQDPKNATYQNKLGIAYHLIQDLNEAKAAYRKAVQIDPKYGPAINNLASVEYAQKKYRAAILAYLRALELTPNDAVIYSNLGTAYFALEKYDYAMSSYKFALQLDPNIFNEAGRTGTMVQQRNTENMGAYNFYMSKTYAEMGKVEETLLFLQKAWEEGFKDLTKELQDNIFSFLAAEPQYQEFLVKINAAENR
ncbi:MAG: hypothetical protein A3F68_05675 [Acidobacteria bacterium RIFCSPLOWO2_12_FULL_54_10]|nr:MAG: hypothetical protein A3F68_05675 [Acidobacteria bacterium RIFCSPLOWO2_12_FULL_54_10]